MVIVFCGFKGGTGKTSTCINVAAQWARAGRQVQVLDLDEQQDAMWFSPTLKTLGVTVLKSNADTVRPQLASAREKGTICLLDTNPSAALELALGLSEADFAVTPINEAFALKNLEMLHRAIEGTHETNPDLQVLYALTMQEMSVNLFPALEADAREKYGDLVLLSTLRKMAAWKYAALQRKDLESYDASHEATREVRAFALELWEKINGN